MKTPKFSVIMPTFNHAEFIGMAINSVLNQTEKDFELIIVNNFSTDNTIKIIKGFKDHRIKLINFRNHGVIASSRNKGIKTAKGKYIAFLDSDDVWHEDKLQICLKFIDKNYEFICHKMKNKIQKKSFFSDALLLVKTITLKNLLFKGNIISTSSVVIKKNILKKVNFFCVSKNIINAEDFYLWLKVLSKGYNCKIIQSELGFSRQHSTNASKNIYKSLKAGIRVLIKLKFSNDNNFLNKNYIFKKSSSILYYGFGFSGLKTKDNFNFLKFLFKAIKNNPFNLKYYLVYFYFKAKQLMHNFY